MSPAASEAEAGEPFFAIEDLHIHFSTRAGVVRAVDGVTLRVERGEVLALVGESGAGKSVTGLSILGLIAPRGRIVSGRILFEGMDLAQLSEEQLRMVRGGRIAVIFQDPMMTLNPVLRIDTQMIEAIRAHHPGANRGEARRHAVDALTQVGISSADDMLKAYPHQYSGGMRQRVVIAIALLNRPALLIADEPTSALDVTIQAQILYEVQKLCRVRGTAIIWITHDLAVVAGIADRVAVMYAGKIVEYGPVDAVLDHPLHPYTRGLIRSVPTHNPRGEPLRQIPGMAPSPLKLLDGCSFRDRCARVTKLCHNVPVLEPILPGRFVRCFHPHVETSS